MRAQEAAAQPAASLGRAGRATRPEALASEPVATAGRVGNARQTMTTRPTIARTTEPESLQPTGESMSPWPTATAVEAEASRTQGTATR